MKKLLIGIVALATIAGFSGRALASARDCDTNAIMWCGAYGKDEFAYKLAGGDGHNTAANLQGVYSSFGVNVEQLKTAVDGSVTKDGKVVVDGKTVATDAKSIGRQFIPGSVKQNGVWIRSTSTSFKSDSLEAFVYMKDGVFQWAVLKACGNVAVATPVPTTAPTPVTPQETPQPVTPPVPTPPAPAPTPAPALPETGMEVPMAAALGTTSVGYGLRGYLRSKKQLTHALRHK